MTADFWVNVVPGIIAAILVIVVVLLIKGE